MTRASLTFHILGTSPLIYNAMSSKTMSSLVLGERGYHGPYQPNPLFEYQETTYRRPPEETGPTRLLLISKMFKMAMCEAALRMPGATKSEIYRSVFVENLYTDLYGIPQIFGTGLGKIWLRFRAIVPTWACKITIGFVPEIITAQDTAKLLHVAGQLFGVGDNRRDYNCGKFRIASEDDAQYVSIINQTTMALQDEALRKPVAWDRDTINLLVEGKKRATQWKRKQRLVMG